MWNVLLELLGSNEDNLILNLLCGVVHSLASCQQSRECRVAFGSCCHRLNIYTDVTCLLNIYLTCIVVLACVGVSHLELEALAAALNLELCHACRNVSGTKTDVKLTCVGCVEEYRDLVWSLLLILWKPRASNHLGIVWK